jgi:hypothetical protein
MMVVVAVAGVMVIGRHHGQHRSVRSSLYPFCPAVAACCPYTPGSCGA